MSDVRFTGTQEEQIRYKLAMDRLAPMSKRGDGGKRPVWRYRPEEIRAMDATDEALAKLRRSQTAHNDMILELAIQMEARWLKPALEATKGLED